MTIEQIKEMVAGEQYDFLRTNPHLGDRIIFLTLGGSYAYPAVSICDPTYTFTVSPYQTAAVKNI